MKPGIPLKRTPFKPRSYDEAIQKQLSTDGYIYPVQRTLRKHSRSNGYKITIGDNQITSWSLRTADTKWSAWIRNRDGRCLRCGTWNDLTNSHFHGRANSGTRFNPDNCDTFCLECHEFMETKKGINQEYWLFKYYQLGQERMDILEDLAQESYSRAKAIKEVMDFLSGNPINQLKEIQI